MHSARTVKDTKVWLNGQINTQSHQPPVFLFITYPAISLSLPSQRLTQTVTNACIICESKHMSALFLHKECKTKHDEMTMKKNAICLGLSARPHYWADGLLLSHKWKLNVYNYQVWDTHNKTGPFLKSHIQSEAVITSCHENRWARSHRLTRAVLQTPTDN